MKLFVAVNPPEEALDHLAEAIQRLRLGMAAAAGTNVRLTARPLWHVTLAFVGEVPDARAGGAEGAVAAGVARWRERGGDPPRLRLAGVGRFGRRAATILWVGLAGEVEGLRELARAQRQALRRARLPYDRKPLRPHLTIARPGDRLPKADLAADLATLSAYEGPEWMVSAVDLVRSHQGPKPVYETIGTVALGSSTERCPPE